MKEKVVLSKYSIVTTAICVVILVALMFVNNPPLSVQLVLGGVMVLMLLSGLFWVPLWISADKYAICIRRCLKTKVLPMQDVKLVKLSPPTMGTIRICGSGGFLGYWGWFRERDMGKYFAYYGRSSDCFLVELKDGRKYMLGCKNAPSMVEYINSFIGQEKYS